MEIPTQTPYTIRKGDSGYEAWAVQRSLNQIQDPQIRTDGTFGSQTKQAVIRFQEYFGLFVDGLFGPASSARMATQLEAEVPTAIPEGLIHGLVMGESGALIAAVSWSSPGGVDCGYCQRRVYSADFQNTAVCKRAFDGLYQMKLLGTNLRSRHDAFYGRPGAQTHERAWRLATLNHNYPAAAVKISEVGEGGLSSYWTTAQSWVTAIGAKFADGADVRTPLEWCERYALGNGGHNEPGQMTKFVDGWTS